MRRILVLNSKGGCGKSTIATNLAGFYASAGFQTALMDYDPQGSAMRWLSLRPEDKPGLHGVGAYQKERRGVTRAWQMRLPAETERIIIDTPAGAGGVQWLQFIQNADVIVMPVLPSPLDIHSAARFIEELLLRAKIRQHGIQVAIVANRVKQNTLVYNSLRRFLGTLQLPFVAHLRDSQNYVKAAGMGVCIHEMSGVRVEPDKLQWAPLLEWLEQVPEKRFNQAHN